MYNTIEQCCTVQVAFIYFLASQLFEDKYNMYFIYALPLDLFPIGRLLFHGTKSL